MPVTNTQEHASSRIPVRDGLLTTPLTDLAAVSLMGTQCDRCRETTLGSNAVCPNCGGTSLRPRPLSRVGTLYTYTVVRYRPPGDYRGPDPFVPFAMGLVELPEGIRVLSPLDCDIDAVRIGMPLQFRARVRSQTEAPQVVTFQFGPMQAAMHGADATP
jgi:uncharacterized OB-fold protein